jgi:6-phosphogluconolactonase
MHTASLFPGADQLELALSTDAPILLPMRADAAGEPRMTLSARVLCAARHIHIMITGPEKRQAFERALTLPAILAPIRAVTQNATIHWAE